MSSPAVVGYMSSDVTNESQRMHLNQDVCHVLESTLGPISSLIPTPTIEQVAIDCFAIDQGVLCEF